MIDKWTNQIRSAVHEASEFHNDSISIQAWEAGLADLKARLDFARNK